jgi:hypothetical protein
MLPIAIRFMKIIGDLWCRILHDSPMWPIHGHYQCRRCLRRFRVPWEAADFSEPQVSKANVFKPTAVMLVNAGAAPRNANS